MILFTDKGERVPRVVRQFPERLPGPVDNSKVYAWPDRRTFRPGYLGIRGPKGYRIAQLDYGKYAYVEPRAVQDWWIAVHAGAKWWPTVAALEMYIRMTT